MVQITLSDTKLREAGELVFDEYLQNFTRDSSKVTNAEAGSTVAVEEMLGIPVKETAGVTEFALAADITTGGLMTGVLVEGPTLPIVLAAAETVVQYSILKRGPAVINELRLPADDAYGDSIVLADFKVELERLGFKVSTQVGLSDTQVT